MDMFAQRAQGFTGIDESIFVKDVIGLVSATVRSEFEGRPAIKLLETVLLQLVPKYPSGADCAMLTLFVESLMGSSGKMSLLAVEVIPSLKRQIVKDQRATLKVLLNDTSNITQTLQFWDRITNSVVANIRQIPDCDPRPVNPKRICNSKIKSVVLDAFGVKQGAIFPLHNETKMSLMTREWPMCPIGYELNEVVLSWRESIRREFEKNVIERAENASENVLETDAQTADTRVKCIALRWIIKLYNGYEPLLEFMWHDTARKVMHSFTRGQLSNAKSIGQDARTLIDQLSQAVGSGNANFIEESFNMLRIDQVVNDVNSVIVQPHKKKRSSVAIPNARSAQSMICRRRSMLSRSMPKLPSSDRYSEEDLKQSPSFHALVNTNVLVVTDYFWPVMARDQNAQISPELNVSIADTRRVADWMPERNSLLYRPIEDILSYYASESKGYKHLVPKPMLSTTTLNIELEVDGERRIMRIVVYIPQAAILLELIQQTRAQGNQWIDSDILQVSLQMTDVVLRRHIAKLIRYGYVRVRDESHTRNFQVCFDFSEEALTRTTISSSNDNDNDTKGYVTNLLSRTILIEFGKVAETQMFNVESTRNPSLQGIIPVKLFDRLVGEHPEWSELKWDEFKDTLFHLQKLGYIVNRGGVYQLDKPV